MSNQDKQRLMMEILELCDSDSAITARDFWKHFQGKPRPDVKNMRDSMATTMLLRNVGGSTNGAKYIITDTGRRRLEQMRGD